MVVRVLLLWFYVLQRLSIKFQYIYKGNLCVVFIFLIVSSFYFKTFASLDQVSSLHHFILIRTQSD